MSITATKKKTQCQRLLAYLRKHRSKGITTMEAFRELGITCVHKRIAEIDGHDEFSAFAKFGYYNPIDITKTWEQPEGESKRIRYKLAR